VEQFTSTTKIVVKVNGRRLLDPPRNLSEVLLEVKIFNRVDVINPMRDKLKALLDKRQIGSMDLLIVFVERKHLI
jgi:hypothetical protein